MYCLQSWFILPVVLRNRQQIIKTSPGVLTDCLHHPQSPVTDELKLTIFFISAKDQWPSLCLGLLISYISNFLCPPVSLPVTSEAVIYVNLGRMWTAAPADPVLVCCALSESCGRSKIITLISLTSVGPPFLFFYLDCIHSWF